VKGSITSKETVQTVSCKAKGTELADNKGTEEEPITTVYQMQFDFPINTAQSKEYVAECYDKLQGLLSLLMEANLTIRLLAGWPNTPSPIAPTQLTGELQHF
jgi:hypothetical protein